MCNVVDLWFMSRRRMAAWPMTYHGLWRICCVTTKWQVRALKQWNNNYIDLIAHMRNTLAVTCSNIQQYCILQLNSTINKIQDRLLYASPAWWGFTNSSDKQRLEAFMRLCVRLNFYRQDDSTVDQLVADLDDGLFAAVLSNDQHVLRCILPERNTHSYSLRPIGAMNLCWQPSVTLETFLKDIIV